MKLSTITANEVTSKSAILLLCCLMITGFAQFRLGLLVEYFTISLGIVLVPLFYVLIDGLPMFPLAALSGIMVAFSRMLVDAYGGGPQGAFVSNYLPETFFYILYGMLFALYCRYRGKKLERVADAVALTFIDYASNMLELFLREGVSELTVANQLSILTIGCLRALVILGIGLLVATYRVSLMRQEDVRMYQQLLFTATELSGEMVWMRENTQMVEQTMNDAYRLYDTLKAQNSPEAVKALSVATKVHEIKKQYRSIMTAVNSALNRNLEEGAMPVSEIFSILLQQNKAMAAEKNIEFNFRIDCPDNLYTVKYYYLMTVFNNFFTNAVEAARDDRENLEVTVLEQGDHYQFTVSNDGKPIPPETIEDIWNAGFSTKIDYESGIVGRGLGLLIVKSIVEKEFSGTVRVSSDRYKTSFVVEIPREEFQLKE